MNCLTDSIFIVGAGVHSELTTQGQVTPKRIKKANKAAHSNPLPAPSWIFAGDYNPQPESKARPRQRVRGL